MFVLVAVRRAILLHAVCPMDVSCTSFRSCLLSSVAFVHILMEKSRFVFLQHIAFLRHPCALCVIMPMFVSMCCCCVDEMPYQSTLSLGSDAYATNLAAGHITRSLVLGSSSRLYPNRWSSYELRIHVEMEILSLTFSHHHHTHMRRHRCAALTTCKKNWAQDV